MITVVDDARGLAPPIESQGAATSAVRDDQRADVTTTRLASAHASNKIVPDRRRVCVASPRG
jgi:hypothetical protein